LTAVPGLTQSGPELAGRQIRDDARGWKVTILPPPRGLTLARALCFGAGGILGVAEARRRSPAKDGANEVLRAEQIAVWEAVLVK
jgi:hypothetical protein